MGLPLYKPKSSSSASDALAKCLSKTNPRHSIRRRARVNNLARHSGRELSRRQQREVFLANFVNERDSDEGSSADAAPNAAHNPPAPRPNLSYISMPALYPEPSHIHFHAPRSDLPHFPPRPLIINGREVEVLDFVFPRVEDDSGRAASDGPARRVVDDRTFERIQEYRRRYWEQYRPADGSSDPSSSSYDPWLAYLRTNGHQLEVMGGASAQVPVPSRPPPPPRNRSASPEHDEFWDTLQTTLTPDPQPPSAGSSFASAAGSAPASHRNSPRPPASIHVSRPTPHDCGGVCDICSRHGPRRASRLNYRFLVRRNERNLRSRSGDSRGNTPRPPPPPPNALPGPVRSSWRSRRNGTAQPAGESAPSGGGGGGSDGADAGSGAPELSAFDSELVRALRSTEARFPMATPGFEGLDAFRRATYARLGLPQDFDEGVPEDEATEGDEEGTDGEPYDFEEHHASHYPWDRFY